MGSRFTGAFAYADDITMLAPCKSALSILVSVCEKYDGADTEINFLRESVEFSRTKKKKKLQMQNILLLTIQLNYAIYDKNDT